MWDNKLKAVTFSFDDGVTQDIRMIELLNRYGLKATFNLNSGLLGEIKQDTFRDEVFTVRKVSPDEVSQVYKDHEVAVHTIHHPRLTEIEDENEIVRQVEQDRLTLQNLASKDVVGMAYPCGGVNNDKRVADIIKNRTGVKYSRTIKSTYTFDLQEDLFRFDPTLNFTEDNVLSVAEEFLKTESEAPQLLYIWGHSYEGDYFKIWERTERLFDMLSGHGDIYYATNREVFGI
ncbi:MAG: polysaccharide deacetylase family protein [Clostridia bacterium]|nr:polysaccharide deacetylase family protein [Clostridia bacterium]